MTKHKVKLTDNRDAFKPFQYPEFYDLWLKHEQIHWSHSVVPMQQDIRDWKNAPDNQRNFLTQILRLFTQGDIDVAGAYINNYLPIFPQPEIRMMLLGFAAREAVHIAAYSHLMESLGFEDSVYTEFFKYQEMAAKHDFFKQISGTDHKQIVQQMCAVSSFTEGMQLFSSFAMLLNFGRNNMFPGMTKIVTWSIIDESCLAKDTEVLTDVGWMPIQDISLSDSILQFDTNTGITEFVHPTNLTHTIRTDSYVFESDTFHQHTTSDHRMIVKDGNQFIDITADKLEDEHATLILNGNKISGEDTLTDEDKATIKLITSGQYPVQWIYDKIPLVSSSWAQSAVEFYLSLLG